MTSAFTSTWLQPAGRPAAQSSVRVRRRVGVLAVCARRCGGAVQPQNTENVGHHPRHRRRGPATVCQAALHARLGRPPSRVQAERPPAPPRRLQAAPGRYTSAGVPRRAGPGGAHREAACSSTARSRRTTSRSQRNAPLRLRPCRPLKRGPATSTVARPWRCSRLSARLASPTCAAYHPRWLAAQGVHVTHEMHAQAASPMSGLHGVHQQTVGRTSGSPWPARACSLPGREDPLYARTPCAQVCTSARCKRDLQAGRGGPGQRTSPRSEATSSSSSRKPRTAHSTRLARALACAPAGSRVSAQPSDCELALHAADIAMMTDNDRTHVYEDWDLRPAGAPRPR